MDQSPILKKRIASAQSRRSARRLAAVDGVLRNMMWKGDKKRIKMRVSHKISD